MGMYYILQASTQQVIEVESMLNQYNFIRNGTLSTMRMNIQSMLAFPNWNNLQHIVMEHGDMNVYKINVNDCPLWTTYIYVTWQSL